MILKNLKETIPYFIIIGIIILIRLFIITPVTVDGPSMENTLQNNEFLILNKFDNTYKRNDIIVFEFQEEKLIKRIIGLPGDKLEIVNNKLYINGEYVEEKYKKDEPEYVDNMEEITIQDNYYFVMGDNRSESFDSRYFGAIKENTILGTVSIRLFPFDKIGFIN
ncbi:MAG: signal peptidase I [Bacilli bacterium]|nr:signal peptidase I [Bacilli bacterium]